jgi:membrane-associated phospholipid phosphatase
MRLAFLAACVLSIAALALLAADPSLDLAVAAWFHGDNGFGGQSALARFARSFLNVTPFVVAALYVALYAAKRMNAWRWWAPSGAGLAFVLLTFAIGPGLIVNLGLKDHAGRPRPTHVTEFGGTDEFRPWNRFDGVCPKNCSFPSGEGAEGFWMIAPALEAPGPWQGPLVAGAALYGAVTSVLRMAFGGHFLSDVVAACLIMLLVIGLGVRLRRGPA